ncbi:MAG: SDR family NAD(P)-dependent oxidoreductase [Parvularculaceae bacterium]|nr:SDR family NAD(P)-dependent oxidoreductase [Parvularculaceae bacterium]
MTNQKPLEVTWDRKPEPAEVMGSVDLTGKRAIVTGGYSGIGLETVRELAARGAKIIVPARSTDKANAALEGINNTHVASMDLSDLSSVTSFADSVVQDGRAVDILINNAGIMASPLMRMGKGWEGQFATNHIGHHVMTNALMPALQKSSAPRVVALSSLAHRRSGVLWDDPSFENTEYEKWVAYGQSKSANALFARGLNNKHEDVLAFSVHPGGIMTDLQRHLAKEEQIALGWMNEDGTLPEAVKPFFKTPAQGAATTLWAATSDMLGQEQGGAYCEDCNVSALVPDDDAGFFGVRSWACSDEDADRLWSLTESMLDG